MYKNCSVTQRLALLQGLLDTDGAATKEGGINILGDLCDMTSEDYAQADLEQTYEM